MKICWVKFFRVKFFSGENFLGENFFDPCPLKEGGGSDGGDRGDGGDGGGEVDQGEVSTIILEMLESSGFRKYSTLLVFQLYSLRLCLCRCVQILIADIIGFHNIYGYMHLWSLRAVKRASLK